MTAPGRRLKYDLALKSIAARYRRPHDARRLSNPWCNGISSSRSSGLWCGQRPTGGRPRL